MTFDPASISYRARQRMIKIARAGKLYLGPSAKHTTSDIELLRAKLITTKTTPHKMRLWLELTVEGMSHFKEIRQYQWSRSGALQRPTKKVRLTVAETARDMDLYTAVKNYLDCITRRNGRPATGKQYHMKVMKEVMRLIEDRNSSEPSDNHSILS